MKNTIKDELSHKKYKNLGWMNQWEKNPKEYKECTEKKHITPETRISKSIHLYQCDECKIYFSVDSSD